MSVSDRSDLLNILVGWILNILVEYTCSLNKTFLLSGQISFLNILVNSNYLVKVSQHESAFFLDAFNLEKNKNKFDRSKTIINQLDVSLLTLTKETYILCVSKIFAAIRLVDAYGTKNSYQNSMSLWQRENWKPVKILGREINFEAIGSPTQAKVCGGPSISWGVKKEFVTSPSLAY